MSEVGHIINTLILISGAWQAAGEYDEQLETEFEGWLVKLQKQLRTNRECALLYLIAAIEEKEAVA